jgi:hypothetical protein
MLATYKQQLDKSKEKGVKPLRSTSTTNPALKELFSLVHAAMTRVDGTDFARAACLSDIQGINLVHGQACFFFTLNPIDVKDSFAMRFVGTLTPEEQSNLLTTNPLRCSYAAGRETRSAVATSNGVGMAKYFNCVITAWLKAMAGWVHSRDGSTRRTDLEECPPGLGDVSAYFGYYKILVSLTLLTNPSLCVHLCMHSHLVLMSLNCNCAGRWNASSEGACTVTCKYG